MLELEIVRFNLLISYVIYFKIYFIPVSKLIKLRDY